MAYCNAGSTAQQWRVYSADNPTTPPAGWYDVWQNVSSGYCPSTPGVGNSTLVRTIPCDASVQYERWHQQ
ncbi:hypothetical protein ACFPK5_06635 [Streptomyces beijiangensis]|uniref:hypothetical protein n=1 Tax=Streptomyces beijiangensis TaxID=163361 RepID=UPI0031E38FAD